MAKLDYYLKNPENMRDLNYLRQYLMSKKEHIVSFRICYHGGYSQTLYKSWYKYVKNGEN